MISNGNNYMRWIEYSISSTIMLYIIALISGVKDSNIYQMLWATNLIMIAQGQLVEQAVQKGGEWWIPMASGFILLLVEWSVIIRDYLERNKQYNQFITDNPSSSSKPIPAWISGMIFVMFLFYASFGAISLYGARKGKTYDYKNIEMIYILLSFIAKATLGFFIGYGISKRQSGQIGGTI